MSGNERKFGFFAPRATQENEPVPLNFVQERIESPASNLAFYGAPVRLLTPVRTRQLVNDSTYRVAAPCAIGVPLEKVPSARQERSLAPVSESRVKFRKFLNNLDQNTISSAGSRRLELTSSILRRP